MSPSYGHKSLFIYPSSIFIFGGKTEKNENTNEMTLFALNEEKIYSIKRKLSLSSLASGIPDARAFFSMTYLGYNLIALYGGMDSSNQTLQDYWHIKIDVVNKLAEGYQVYASESSDNSLMNVLQMRKGEVFQTKNSEFPLLFGSISSSFFLDSSDIL